MSKQSEKERPAWVRSEREMLEWVAQTVHQAYHERDTWRDCPKDICASIRAHLVEVEG